jgi:integrase
VREIWTAYLVAEAEHLRPNTRRLYSEAWRTWEQYIGPDSEAEGLTIQQIHDYRRELDGRGLSTATVQDKIRNVRIVYNWAERNELIRVNKWHLFVYKVAKEKRTKPRAEYRSDEFLAIWRALDPSNAGQWRAWVAVGLLGIYGNRQNEILNLRWSWIDGDTVTIDPSVVKTGEEGTLTLFPLTRGILDVAREWRAREAYTGDYVLFPGKRTSHATTREHYSIQSLTDALHRAERRAGVDVIEWRAGHGFRRGLVGDLAEQTGDVQLALQAIGDKDIRMAAHYRRRRNDRVAAVVQERAARLGSATNVQRDDENTNASSVETDEANRVTEGVSTLSGDAQ